MYFSPVLRPENRPFVQLNAPKIAHVVFIDEDSDAAVLKRFLADQLVSIQQLDPHFAAVAPAHRDRGTGLRARHMVLRRWSWQVLSRDVHGMHRVAFVINSMSVWRMAALQAIGPYNEWLGVDHIDTEYCLRARQLGLAVYVHGDFEFAQSIGQRRSYRLFGHELQSGGHGPPRRFTIGRNTTWLGRRYLIREPAFAILCAARIVYEGVGIVVAETERWPKLGSLLWGVVLGAVAQGCNKADG